MGCRCTHNVKHYQGRAQHDERPAATYGLPAAFDFRIPYDLLSLPRNAAFPQYTAAEIDDVHGRGKKRGKDKPENEFDHHECGPKIGGADKPQNRGYPHTQESRTEYSAKQVEAKEPFAIYWIGLDNIVIGFGWYHISAAAFPLAICLWGWPTHALPVNVPALAQARLSAERRRARNCRGDCPACPRNARLNENTDS